MSIINVLDKSVYNRIAAGEVVERPASVVKELVENSIDAGSTEIYIGINGGGKDVIEVFDNGNGIYKDDLKKAVLAHATSKISNADDLDNIITLGFRGEALASIASVSKLRITSMTKDSDIGYTYTVNGGEGSEIVEAPATIGTKIIVSNLFYNTPARQKFLKSERSEENEITDVVSRLILSNPEVAFKYESDGKIVLQSFGDSVEEAMISVYGLDTVKNCFKISNYVHGVKIEGYIGKHNFTKSNRSYQTIILNGRTISNNTIQSAIHNAYASYLMKRRYEFYVLYITMPPEVVDVNVTPNKTDVRFVDNSVVYGALYSTISKVLDGTDSALDIISNSGEAIAPSPNSILNRKTEDKNYSNVVIVNKSSSEYVNKKYVKDNFDDFAFTSFKVSEDSNLFSDKPQNQTQPKPKSDIFAENKRYIEELERKKLQEATQIKIPENLDLKYVGQVLNSFLIFEGGGDVYLVDQHAAHERLLYNKIVYMRRVGGLTVQPLIVPYDFSINSYEYEVLYSKLNYFENLGIEIELKENRATIYSVPLELSDINLQDFFGEVLGDSHIKNETLPEIINDKLIQKACKSAIKAGMPLDNHEVKSLMTLLNGNVNLKCPHGRPIAVRLTRTEIDKWFKRIV